MGYVPLETLLPKSNYSIYGLVRLAAKRALELAEGQPSLSESITAQKLTSVALREISDAKVVMKSVASEFKPDTKTSDKTTNDNASGQ